ncbi:polysaccharide pyruvyl transferase CsaB (plasmid) [Pontibacillus sp. ALD_SL1]|uniref:polysaccharide pyruvyl transferase CsaB n=1 Tax=Pontibacillus sp. ALD_SL1 TaxID=2777185 RepID=UPI001A96FA02|nr:polysaccharide pyruvyl transferase CsaB [Pontibacillus sp. ALD_SL1]QST02733.1 polysaccharide pyruvyl transferase CsaB [Pontibacillus sp. ALD_SL1]
MKTVLLCGYYGFGNAGDDAILLSLIQQLQEEGYTPIVLSAKPAISKQLYGVDCYHRFSPLAVHQAFKRCDRLIMGGGTLLQSVTSSRSLLYYLSIMRLSFLYRKPVSFIAQGGGPFMNHRYDRMIRDTLNRCEEISVRDETSLKLYRSLGVTRPIRLTEDPVLHLKLTEPHPYPKLHFDHPRPLIGISVRSWVNDAMLIKEMKEACLHWIDRGFNIVFIPFHHPHDVHISNGIASELPAGCVHVIEGELPVLSILTLVGDVDVLVGMRLHSLIFAANQSTPYVGVSYDPKIDAFLERHNEHAACSAAHPQAEKLIQAVERKVTHG